MLEVLLDVVRTQFGVAIVEELAAISDLAILRERVLALFVSAAGDPSPQLG